MGMGTLPLPAWQYKNDNFGADKGIVGSPRLQCREIGCFLRPLIMGGDGGDGAVGSEGKE